jgi:uncharacterized membrane protein YhaH (DUF805 family)
MRNWHKPLMWSVAVMGVTLLLSLGGLLFDDRVLRGEPIWLKPFKFSVSIGIYSFTLAWLLSMLTKRRRAAWWMGTITATAIVVEMVVIVTQVFRGEASHFNLSTDFNGTMFAIMGTSIVILWVANAVIAVMLLLERSIDRPLAWALRLGLLVALAGMAVAFLMPQPTPDQLALLKADLPSPMIGGHSVGVPDGGPGMPITHWSTTGGDLRVPHFVGIHAMQALPLLALFLRRYSRRDSLTQSRLVIVGAAGYTGLFLLVFWQALRAQPLVAPDGLTLGVLGLLAAGVAVAATAVLRTKTPTRVEVTV